MLKHINGSSTPNIVDISAGVYDGYTTKGSGKYVPPKFKLLITFSDAHERNQYHYAHGRGLGNNLIEIRLMMTRYGYSSKGQRGAQQLNVYNIATDSIGQRVDASPNQVLWGTNQKYLGINNLETFIGNNDVIVHYADYQSNGDIVLRLEVVNYVQQHVQRATGPSSSVANFTSPPNTQSPSAAPAQPAAAPAVQPVPSLAPAATSYPVSGSIHKGVIKINRNWTPQKKLEMIELCTEAGQNWEFEG